jgi:hypothetical protein
MVADGTTAAAFGANGVYRCHQEKGKLQVMFDARTTVAISHAQLPFYYVGHA